MNWLTHRVLAGAAMLMAFVAIGLTVTSDFHRDRLDLARHTLMAAAIPLVLSALIALRLRKREWRDRPEKARRLALIPYATALTWAVLLVPILGLTFD
ncbi:hypothetical protein [Scleromatobacter humisilvae]|uniref:Uncharacterized protein n=1 Tax=Scleromatobacter humisilvae TaxID=2897159 RepID=A0A9X1YGN2_9BURK|nr:hypothetical protein [Scleromatobacter humisilvae]MCK9686154.1 hypothetical protein [Scleromatobacter humisilvae]